MPQLLRYLLSKLPRDQTCPKMPTHIETGSEVPLTHKSLSEVLAAQTTSGNSGLKRKIMPTQIGGIAVSFILAEAEAEARARAQAQVRSEEKLERRAEVGSEAGSKVGSEVGSEVRSEGEGRGQEVGSERPIIKRRRCQVCFFPLFFPIRRRLYSTFSAYTLPQLSKTCVADTQVPPKSQPSPSAPPDAASKAAKAAQDADVDMDVDLGMDVEVDSDSDDDIVIIV